jgi:metal-responsive CopG/Arc/MetJ family transcriptional regulator
MESTEQSREQEMVRLTLELPRDLVDWIDGLRIQMGFRNRGLIVAQLLRELIPETDEIGYQQQESTDEV